MLLLHFASQSGNSPTARYLSGHRLLALINVKERLVGADRCTLGGEEDVFSIMKIAIFGGAFNPVHIGHVQLVQTLLTQLNFDKILIVPSKLSPHKSSNGLIDGAHRMKMCEIAFADVEKAQVCDIEMNRSGKSYTVDTLIELKKRFANDELYLICGSDMFLTLQEWRNYEKIIKLAHICGIKRANEDENALTKQKKRLEKDGAKVYLTFAEIADVSSTMIRFELQNGKFESAEKYLPQGVLDYIMKNLLYKPQMSLLELQVKYDDLHGLLKKRLNFKRYVHSVNVANKAYELAVKYVANADKAYYAGLCHDICKNESKENTLKLFKKFAIMLDDVTFAEPKLWHAVAGAAYIERVLNVADSEIINAVRYHTTGRADMSLLEKIVYISDFVSDERDFDGVDEIRKSLEGGLDNALLTASRFTVLDLCGRGIAVHNDSIALYNQMVLKKNQK